MPKGVVYKCVFRMTNGSLISISTWYSRWETEYVPGQWTEAKMKGTGLFVFESLETALRFLGLSVFESTEAALKLLDDEYADQGAGPQVWVAEAEGLRPPPGGRIPHMLMHSSYNTWEKYWQSDPGTLAGMRLNDAPAGTLVADRVKLVERMRWANDRDIRQLR